MLGRNKSFSVVSCKYCKYGKYGGGLAGGGQEPNGRIANTVPNPILLKRCQGGTKKENMCF